MGRKIPGRKHRGVRDPDKQRAERNKLLKNKINAPPSDPDAQDFPKSLQNLINLKEQASIPKTKRKKPKPEFIQGRGESDNHYFYRVKEACNARLQENMFENKYDVDIKRNPKTGQVEKVVKRKKSELDEYLEKKRKEDKVEKKGGKKKKKNKLASNEPRLTKSQKWQKKLNERKQRAAMSKADEFGDFRDNVKFGEVVHAPPTLQAPRKVEQLKNAPRPGKKNLILNNLMQPSDRSEKNRNFVSKPKDVLNKTANNVIIDKKGKRKDLPAALRRQLDKQQAEVINAYKLLKKSKLLSESV